MNIDEMRKMPKDELYFQIKEANKDLFEARCKHTVSQLENTAVFGMLRNRIAQLQTVLAEKKQAS